MPFAKKPKGWRPDDPIAFPDVPLGIEVSALAGEVEPQLDELPPDGPEETPTEDADPPGEEAPPAAKRKRQTYHRAPRELRTWIEDYCLVQRRQGTSVETSTAQFRLLFCSARLVNRWLRTRMGTSAVG